jgi:AcrR family transcriptional regulator
VKKQSVEERRTEILETTCEVVIERGFAGTRISDVAKRLDVSSSLIHYHFDSKEQLLAEAFAHYARKDLAEMLGEVESAPSALAKLDRVIHNYVPEGSGDVEWMLWIDGWGEALRNPMMKKISQELDEQSAELLERVIAGGVEAGEFSCADPRSAAMRLTALVDGLAIQFAAHDGMMDRRQLIDHVRTVAAAEVGLGVEAFEGASGDPVEDGLTTPGAATDTALRQLIARYCDAVSRIDGAAWAATFTPDGRWELPDSDPIVGRDALNESFTSKLEKYQWIIQTPGNCYFEVNEAGGYGHGRITIQERWKPKNAKAAGLIGIYDDEYRRVDTHWLFARRTLTVIETT